MRKNKIRRLALVLSAVLLCSQTQYAAAFAADGRSEGALLDFTDHDELLGNLSIAEPGVDYADQEVIFFLGQDPDEEKLASAKRVAFSCNGRLIDYEGGVGLVRLPSSTYEAKVNAGRYAASAYGMASDFFLFGRSYEALTVKEAVKKSIEDPALPVFEPNYYQLIITGEDYESDAITFMEGVSSGNDGAFGVSENAADAAFADSTEDADTFADGTSVEDPFLSISNSNYQYHHHMTGVDAAWEAGYTGKSEIKVGVIDTGVPSSHTDLPNVIQVQHNSRNIPLSPDKSTHGTHVAGIIGAAAGNGAGGSGIAPGVTIMSYNICKTGPNSIEDYDVITAMLHCIEDGVDIINMSLGGPLRNGILKMVTDCAYEAGITVIAAMGNNGSELKNYPASYDHVIAVGAVGESGMRARYSSYGPWCAISAPGSGIVSTVVPMLTSDYQNGKPRFTSEYGKMNGTSQATPIVSGAAALYMSAFGNPGPDNMREYLTRAVSECPSYGMGAGIIDVAKLMKVSNSTFTSADPKKLFRVYINDGGDPYDNSDMLYMMAGSTVRLGAVYDTDSTEPLPAGSVKWQVNAVPSGNVSSVPFENGMISVDDQGVLKVDKKCMKYLSDPKVNAFVFSVRGETLDNSIPENCRYEEIYVYVVKNYSKFTKEKKWETDNLEGYVVKKKTSKIKLNAASYYANVFFTVKSYAPRWRIDSSDPEVAGALFGGSLQSNDQLVKSRQTVTIVRGTKKGTTTITARCLDGSGKTVKWTVTNK